MARTHHNHGRDKFDDGDQRCKIMKDSSNQKRHLDRLLVLSQLEAADYSDGSDDDNNRRRRHRC